MNDTLRNSIRLLFYNQLETRSECIGTLDIEVWDKYAQGLLIKPCYLLNSIFTDKLLVEIYANDGKAKDGQLEHSNLVVRWEVMD